MRLRPEQGKIACEVMSVKVRRDLLTIATANCIVIFYKVIHHP